ncbi:MAG TPA: sporulation protein YtxC [Bacillota bacterium]|nr:sporulation protein YtxC [Bacillota bacterium]
MKTLYLPFVKEANSFCERLQLLQKDISCTVETDETWGKKINFQKNYLSKQLLHDMSETLVSIFTSFRLLQFIESIVRESYYFTEDEEIRRILELSQEIILQHDDHGLPVYKQRKLHNLLQKIFIEQLQQTDSFHYDSIVKFCLTPFKQQLVDEVGLVIDDFKREEEHQAIVQMIREYIEDKYVVYETIHLLHGRNFRFYTPTGERLTKQQLRPLMSQTPLYLFGLNLQEWNLAPLIAISPRRIFVYGELSEAKMLMLMNVFQERVIMKPLQDFPFEQ